jgi:hypothetical protein
VGRRGEQAGGQLVLQLALDRAAQWAGAQGRSPHSGSTPSATTAPLLAGTVDKETSPLT